MIELAPRHYHPNTTTISRFSGQPVLIGAAAFVIIVFGIGCIALWRTYTGTSPELDRLASARQLQARTVQASEQLVEKTKGLEATQQESIDQLQVVQDQLLAVRRLLSAQQTDTKKLSEQVSTLTESIDGLRQSFASARSSDPAPAARRSARVRSQPVPSVHRKRGKSQG